LICSKLPGRRQVTNDSDDQDGPSRCFRRADLPLASASLYGAAPGSVSGTVRDSTGVPQIGARCRCWALNLTVIASVYTDADGRFIIPRFFPGPLCVQGHRRLVSAVTAREHSRPANTVVNLTLNNALRGDAVACRLSRARATPRKTTGPGPCARPPTGLCCAGLRWSAGGGLGWVRRASRLKARLMASGQEGTFGESGERIAAAIEDTLPTSRELWHAWNSTPVPMRRHGVMLGFRQDLGLPARAIRAARGSPSGYDRRRPRGVDEPRFAVGRHPSGRTSSRRGRFHTGCRRGSPQLL